MTSEQTFSTHDLRSGAVDYNRDHEHKAKWAHGQAWGPGRDTGAHARPVRLEREAQHMRRDGVPVATHKARARQGRKRDCTADKSDTTSGDSSADDDIDEPSVAPAPDAGVAYSFDARRGPGEGSQILSLALDKALERYEVRATDKLIKDEYEVLGLDGEPVVTRTSAKGKKAAVLTDDEEFELI